jgi:hypothetical protein
MQLRRKVVVKKDSNLGPIGLVPKDDYNKGEIKEEELISSTLEVVRAR